MTYTVTGRYPTGDLAGRPGELRFTPTTTLIGAGNIILPAPLTVPLDADGRITTELVGTDDPLYEPSGWVWIVEERLPGGRAPWYFALTADLDLSEVEPLTPAPVFLAGSAVLVLDSGQPVPVGTPTGTVILRRS